MPRRLFTSAQRDQILESYARGARMADLAKQFYVTKSRIGQIVKHHKDETERRKKYRAIAETTVKG